MSRPLPGEVPELMSSRELEFSNEMMNQIEATADYDVCDIMFHDNRGESYRDEQEEGLLFVHRAPHEVRPPVDTGVGYTCSEADHKYSVSLNNAPKRPEYNWNSVRLDDTRPVCQACRDVFNYYCRYFEARLKYQTQPEEDRPKFALSNSVVHHFNLFSLLAWANIGKCYLCQILLNRLERMYEERLQLANYEMFRTEVCWMQGRELEKKDTLYFVITNPSRKREFWNFSHYFDLSLWPVPTFSSHFTLPARIQNREIFPSTRSPTSRALAAVWLSQCKANQDGNHDECNKRDGDYLPTRVLDVKHAQKTGRLRIVGPALDPASFVEDREWMTLSHCWGEWGAKNNPILTKGNLKKRQKVGLSLDKVPKTFQDALEIAGWLNINWLWIDCLCIIQDSKDDWLREAKMMSQIYQNAALNVSADSGMDSRAGCFVQRDLVDILPLDIHSPQLSQSWKVLPHPAFLFDWMRRTQSFSRAWIHRERQLARRVLHFTDKEMIWECCGREGTSFASEMLPGGAPFKNGLFNSDRKYQIGRLQQGLQGGAEETYATWNDICEHLSDKRLSKPADMPIVLSGLANDFAHLLPADDYVAGLWRSTLPHSLLWHTRSFKVDGLKYIAPSWSWLSTDCAVTLANRFDIMKKDRLAKILSISPKPEYQDLNGPVKTTALEVKGMLRHIQIDLKKRSKIFDLSVLDHEGKIEHTRAIGPSWTEHWGDLCTLELDATSRNPLLDCFAMFITIHQSKDIESCREIACLLLQRCGKKGSKFTRIGTLVLGDLYGLKMRYELLKNMNEETWEGMQKRIKNAQDPIIEAEKKRAREKKERDDREIAAEDATSDTIVDTHRQCLEGVDALYQFDNGIESFENLQRLAPQIITIV